MNLSTKLRAIALLSPPPHPGISGRTIVTTGKILKHRRALGIRGRRGRRWLAAGRRHVGEHGQNPADAGGARRLEAEGPELLVLGEHV